MESLRIVLIRAGAVVGFGVEAFKSIDNQDALHETASALINML